MDDDFRQADVDISFCIVNLNAGEYLRACLLRLPEAAGSLRYEIIVVDNGSVDRSREILQSEFPAVKTIFNRENLGYSLPMNQALKIAQGKVLVQINPDTLPDAGMFERLNGYLLNNPQAGIISPKVLNRDGTLQRQCRRSAARPWDVITYFLGLHRVFPRSRLLGRYLLTYLDDDEIAEVEAVSGSCMVIRREVVQQIGYLDEQFFAYQEDSDFCFRARQAGWKVVYVPLGSVVHYGGMGGSRTQPFRGIVAWHKSYYRYYRKNLAEQYFFLINWMMYLAIAAKLAISLLANALKRDKIVGTKKP